MLYTQLQWTMCDGDSLEFCRDIYCRCFLNVRKFLQASVDAWEPVSSVYPLSHVLRRCELPRKIMTCIWSFRVLQSSSSLLTYSVSARVSQLWSWRTERIVIRSSDEVADVDRANVFIGVIWSSEASRDHDDVTAWWRHAIERRAKPMHPKSQRHSNALPSRINTMGYGALRRCVQKKTLYFWPRLFVRIPNPNPNPDSL